LADFADCLLTGREPVSGLDLAVETVKAIYAAYLSAEKGMRVEMDKNIT
jgi:predicted dehydrogenase